MKNERNIRIAAAGFVFALALVSRPGAAAGNDGRHASGNETEPKTAVAPRTSLKVLVKDTDTGEPLIGAAVMISNTTEGAVTDLDGKCELVLDKGKYPLVVSYIGYTSYSFKVETADLTEGILEISLAPDHTILENAVVTGRKNFETISALQQERKNSAFAIENMGAREMSVKGLSNAQESVSKLSGISIASAGQLIVRGLGDRYSTTTLNGLPIASPNPDNKLIPLDIFPSSTIQNITVSKVYEASSFADYSGAHVDISTKEGKSDDFFGVSFSTGGYFGTIFRDFYKMDSRSLFASPRLDPEVENLKYSQFADYSRNNRIFDTSFQVRKKSALPDLNGNIGFGKNFRVGSQTLSLLASASIKSGNETMQDAYYRTYEASSEGNLMNSYIYDGYTSKLDIAALLNLEYTLRESDHIGLTAFFARNAKDTYMDRQGNNFLEGYDLVGINSVSHYYMLQNYQLSGHHELGGHKWLIDWGASYSLTSSDEPDRRQVMFRRGDDGQLSFFQLNQQETQRYFGKLAEAEAVADIRATYSFNDDDRIRFGLTAKDKSREFRTTRFYYNLKQLTGNIDDVHDMDSYLNFENIASGLVSIDRKQHARDKYDAFNLIGAAFVEGDFKFGEKWFLNAGLRFEASRQSVDYNDDVEDKTRNLDAFDLFPAVNLKFAVTEQSALRLALSRTITRPSFVEMAPFLYQESFGGAQIRGNDALENGYNYNIDLKYEFFRENSSDMAAVTGYFKYLDNPIERTQRVAGGATEHSFQNAENGLAAGVEVEVRKLIVKYLTFSANASYMFTNVKLPEGGVYTNAERSLQGASPYLVNADITYSPKFSNGAGLNLAVLYNLQGPRIQSVGILGLGDVTQQPFHSLDFAGSYDFNEHFSLKVGIKNILNSSVKYIQDIPDADRTVEVEGWRIGTGFELGLSYDF